MDSCKRLAYGLLVYALIVSVWALATGLGWVEPIILPSPLSVAQAMIQLILHDSLLRDLLVTLGRVFAALVISMIVGIPVGLLFGFAPRVYAAVEGPLHALRSVPATCLFPLLLIVIGVGEMSIVALAAYPCLLILMVNSATGASLADPSRVRQAKLLGLSPARLVVDVLFYEALPHITSAVRTAISYALVLVVAVEMFIGVGQPGLGRKIFDFQSGFRIPETYASIIVTGLLGIGLNAITNLVERRLLRWLPQVAQASRRSR